MQDDLRLFPYPLALAQYPTVRQSILASFDLCALTTAMSLEYEQGWSHHYQARGTLAHRVFAKCLKTMYEYWADAQDGHDDAPLKPGTIPTEVAEAILLETLRQHDVEPRDVVNLPTDEIKDLRWVVIKWAYDNVFDIEHLVDVEQRIEAPITYPNPQGGYVERTISGQLDALFIMGENLEHAVVLDWKDTWGLPGPNELGFDGYFQQRMYAYLVFRQYPSVQQVTLKEFYVRFSEPREATVHREDMEGIEAELSALVERFDRAVQHGELPWKKEAKEQRKRMRELVKLRNEAKAAGDYVTAAGYERERNAIRRVYENTVGLWQPSPGKHCDWCVRPESCTIHPSARGPGKLVDEATAERVAAETLVARAAEKKGKAALKEWSDTHGDIPIKDAKGPRVWGHRPIKRNVSPKPEDIRRELELAHLEGRPPNIEGLWREVQGTRFEAYMPKPLTDDATDEDREMIAALEASIAEAQARKEAEAA